MDWRSVARLFFSVEWNIQTLSAAIAGFATFIATCYKLYERWSTREERRLRLLHQYLDQEEQDITSRRNPILSGIETTKYAWLEKHELNIGAELDEAMRYINRGFLEEAEREFVTLAKRIENKQRLVNKQADDLKTHLATVQIFLAAIGARHKKDLMQGLKYASDALQVDRNDKDALKYAGRILLEQGDLQGATQYFNRLKQRSIGPENDHYRAAAWEGLGLTQREMGEDSILAALTSLQNALNNLRRLSPDVRDSFAAGRIHTTMAEIYESNSTQMDLLQSKYHYGEAITHLKASNRGAAEDEVRRLRNKLEAVQRRSEEALADRKIDAPQPTAEAPQQ